MALEATDTIRQFSGMVRMVIQTTQKDVLETDAPPRDRQVMAAVVQERLIGIGMGPCLSL